MAFDDLPPADNPTPPVIIPTQPPATETRNILDQSSNIIGTLTLPAGSSEAVWAALLATYAGQAVSASPNVNEFASSISTNTNSSSYVPLNGMISGGLDAGTYLVTFTGNISSTAPLLSNPGFFLSFFANGNQILTSEVGDASSSLSLFSISPIAMSFNSIITIGTGQRIEVRWKTNGQGNTITCTNRILDIVRMR